MLLFHNFSIDFDIILLGHCNEALRYETHNDYYYYTGADQ